MSLQIIIIECIGYINIYNMSICLFIINKISKAKAVNYLKCASFVDLL